MAEVDWPVQWTAKVTLSVILGMFTLYCADRVGVTVVKEFKKSGTTSKSSSKTASEEWEEFFRRLYLFFAGIAPFLFYTMIVVFLCDGEEFVLKSGDLWLDRHQAYTGIVIVYILVCMMFKVESWVRRILIGSPTGNLSDDDKMVVRWAVIVNELLEVFVLTFGLVIITTIFKKDHTNGVYGFTVFVFCYMIAAHLSGFCFAIAYKKSAFEKID